MLKQIPWYCYCKHLWIVTFLYIWPKVIGFVCVWDRHFIANFKFIYRFLYICGLTNNYCLPKEAIPKRGCFEFNRSWNLVILGINRSRRVVQEAKPRAYIEVTGVHKLMPIVFNRTNTSSNQVSWPVLILSC